MFSSEQIQISESWSSRTRVSRGSISLHRSLDGRRIVNYVQWENRDLLRSAHQSQEFRKQWNDFDKLADEIDPNLYEVSEVMDA